jgi:hypothetical protein
MQKHHALGFIKVTTPDDKTAYVRCNKIIAVIQASKNDDGVVSGVDVGTAITYVKNQAGAIISQIEEVPPALR